MSYCKNSRSENLKSPAAFDENFWRKINNLTKAMKNLVERSSPEKIKEIPGWEPFLMVTTRYIQYVFEAIIFLSADSPEDPKRKLEFGICTSPLIRSLIDLLFNIIFIRESPRPRLNRYYKAGWRETREILDILENRYSANPNWTGKLKARNNALEELRVIYKISANKAKNLHKIPYWPIPSKILRTENLRPRSRRFLEFLNLWYREFSQDHHMSGGGIIRVYSKFLIEPDDEDRDRILKEIKSGNVILAVTLVLAISTEINDIGNYDQNSNLSYLWGILILHRSEALELYNLRYRVMLQKKINSS